MSAFNRHRKRFSTLIVVRTMSAEGACMSMVLFVYFTCVGLFCIMVRGDVVPTWCPPQCMPGGQTRNVLFKKDDRTIKSGKAPTPSHSVEYLLLVGLGVVGITPPSVEWGWPAL